MNNHSDIWQTLTHLAATTNALNIAELINEESRAERYTLTLPGLHLDYTRHLINNEILSSLLALATASDVRAKAVAMMRGDPVNRSEHRGALHTGLRGTAGHPPEAFLAATTAQRERMYEMAEAIRTGNWTGMTGEKITDVINIGIGGSDLGPKMTVDALREYHDGPAVHFISNVDGAEIATLLKQLEPASTLVVISSKTFTTAETMLNAETALAWLAEGLGISDPASSKHCIGVTGSPERAQDFGLPATQLLTFPDSIGGRYSTWSTIGLAVCIAVGSKHFDALLRGGAAMDEHFLTADYADNMPVIMALLGIWYSNFLGAQSHAVIPYCQRLRLFVDHLQQLDMESNGKSVTLDGSPCNVDTGPVIWGQTGTNGQHAFFQLLHQGTRVIPVDFIGAVEDSLSDKKHHRILLANMIAQGEALMKGQPADSTSTGDVNQHYPGNRPSSTLLLDKLTPATLGQLLALYEHKVFVQSVIWSVNPFDQWGVELGKVLAGDILGGTGEHDPATLDLLRRTGLAG